MGNPIERWAPALTAVLALWMASCATQGSPPLPGSDGPEARMPPLDPMQVPDAMPVLEPIRAGGPNKPYVALGETIVPLAPDAALTERGQASWYGRKFHGRRTASGELYNMYAMTAAHRTLPLPSFARVSNPANGRSVIVRVNDRGPFVKDRVIDLSYVAAQKLGVQGVALVEVVRITPEEIRRGNWQAAADPSTSPPRVIDGDDPPAISGAAVSELAPTGRGHWLQLGAFRERKGAEALQGQASAAVEGLAPMLALYRDGALYRLQAGPFAGRAEALRWAERVRGKLSLVPLLLERR